MARPPRPTRRRARRARDTSSPLPAGTARTRRPPSTPPRVGRASRAWATSPTSSPPRQRAWQANATYEPYLFNSPSDYVTKLSQDYHLNAFQYYDWQYRHEQPVATGDIKEQWPLWYENNYASAATINSYVTTADNVGAASLAYSMAYAANDNYDTNKIKDEWRLHNENGFYWDRKLGVQWWVQTPKGVDKPTERIARLAFSDSDPPRTWISRRATSTW